MTGFQAAFSLRTEADQYYRQEEFTKAVTLYEQIAETNPYDGELHKRIGECEARLGHRQRAIDAYHQALRLGCKFPGMVYYEMARLCAELSHRIACLDWLEKSLLTGLGGRSGLAAQDVFKPYYDDPRFRELVGVLPSAEMDRNAGWHFDLDFFVQEAQRLHVGPHRPAYSEKFISMAAELHARIPSLSDEQIFMAIQRLVVLLGDGHSRLHPTPTDRAALKMLPVNLWLFSDGLFIISGLEGATRWAGWRVLRFGSRSVEEVLNEVRDYVPADNSMQLKWSGMTVLTLPACLQALGASDNTASATLTVQDKRGQVQEVLFMGEALRPRSRPKLSPSALNSRPAPLYLRDTETNIWYQALPESHALYVQYNQVRDTEVQTIEAFAARLQEEIRSTIPKNLIVDVRHNGGGNNFLNWPLVRTLVHFDVADASNRLFIITGRGTFSAAQNFINWVERTTRAIFVGEPSSSRPNFVGETTEVVLPYSRIEGSISSRMHFDSFWGDERTWIAPHVPITLSSDDYFANRDPALDTVLAIIQSG